MPLQRKYANIVYSLITVLCWTGLIFFFAYPSNDPPADLGLERYLFYTLFFALGFGAIVVAIKFLKMLRDKSNFFYVFAGVLNACVGILGIILLLVGALDKMWVELFTISFILGVAIIVEIVLDKTQQPAEANEGEYPPD